MKKTQFIITILVFSLLFSACGSEQKQETTTVQKTTTTTTDATSETTATTAATTENTAAEETTNSTSNSEQATDDGKLSDMPLDAIANKLIANISDMPMTENFEVTADTYPNYLFIDYIEGSEALASEAMMSSVAHSVVLLKLPEGSDVEKIRSEIEKNADPQKWICVAAEKTEVVSNGNLILLVMSFEDIADTIVDQFKSMK